MKKYILILLSLLSIIFVGCSSNYEDEKQHIGLSAKAIYFQNLEEMEKYSDIIVLATLDETEKPIIKYSEGNLVNAYTFSEIIIDEVYKGKEVEKGDKITILENEAYDPNTKTVYHIAGYNMMKAENHYLLFLHKANDGNTIYYVSSGVNCGTISLDDDGRDEIRYDERGKAVVDYSNYIGIWKEAKNKYINQR